MPKTDNQPLLTRQIDVSTRLSIPQMKKNLIRLDVFSDMTFIAKTGTRRVLTQAKDGSERIEIEVVSAKDHIDVLKCLVNKILPNTKETVEVSEDYSRWLTHTELEQSDVRDMPPAQREEAAKQAKAKALEGSKSAAQADTDKEEIDEATE